MKTVWNHNNVVKVVLFCFTVGAVWAFVVFPMIPWDGKALLSPFVGAGSYLLTMRRWPMYTFTYKFD